MSTLTVQCGWNSGRIDPARLRLFQGILECISGTAQTPKGAGRLVRPKWQRPEGYRYTRGEIEYVASNRDIDPRGNPIRRMRV